MSDALREIRARLDGCARAIQDALGALPDEVMPPEGSVDAGEALTCFELGGERFALASRWVRGPVRTGRPTPLPASGPSCVGVVDVDGELLPAFDPAALLGLDGRGAHALSFLAIGPESRAELALVADRVAQGCHRSQVHPFPWPLSPEATRLVRGLLDDATVLLDGERLLDDPRLGATSP